MEYITYLETSLPEPCQSIGKFLPSKDIIYEIFTPRNPTEPFKINSLTKITSLGQKNLEI